MADIAIIDYGMGNVHSVCKALNKVLDKNSTVKITNSLNDLSDCSHIVFPGQGAASECMININKNLDIIEFKKVISQKPFLGICMGLQVLMTHSEENEGSNCLNILDGKVLSIERKMNSNLKVPHMGWNKVKLLNNQSQIFKESLEGSRFYFVHSYYVKCNNSSDVLTKTDYGLNFDSSFESGNIFGVQFHPEKSHSYGIHLFKNFIKIQ